MKKLLCAVAVIGLLACQSTPQKIGVNTLTTVGQAGETAYEAYLYDVAKGTLPTNDVPKVTGYYKDFHASFAVAAVAAQFATNTTLANPDLTDALTKLESAIATIRGGK